MESDDFSSAECFPCYLTGSLFFDFPFPPQILLFRANVNCTRKKWDCVVRRRANQVRRVHALTVEPFRFLALTSGLHFLLNIASRSGRCQQPKKRIWAGWTVSAGECV